MRRLGVLIAVADEASRILLDECWAWSETEPGFYRSGSRPIVLAVSGVGKVFAAYAVARMLDDCDLMLGMGTSGGLSDENLGSIWICSEFIERDMDCSALWFEPGVTPYACMDGSIIQSAGAELVTLVQGAAAAVGLETRECRTATGDSFIADPALARNLREHTGARLCDMESAAAAKICRYRAHKEFIALRAVSDNADRQARRSWEEQVKLSAKDFAKFLGAFVERL